ncbi:hypothetical protein GX50_06269 [[Emmonsia] crescens]|uniref:Uncharacterized protein n=1 Tax=[Emmonsia] crescens TaxID=73230 RepID=A0A2B7ZCS5_9EURO|nr:hypothetical protein GX50_06269 [Emmonsia crescens]
MQCELFTDSFGSTPGRHGRSVSLSGDTPLPTQSMLSPPPVNPEPQFIAATAAAQIVSADQNLNGVDPSAGTIGASVTPPSLTLINRFLDNLLFNILMTAKSTNLNAIRPALAEVLKPRLAKEVVSAADEELSEYMGGGENEELSDFRGGREPAGQFELERSWKLTRLRCMVYTRLGDMEEEDEEEHLRREGLSETDVGPARFSNYIGHITPAAAIFLTSILEYIGEHSLIIAGEAASTRMRSGRSSRARDEHFDAQDVEILVVEEMDMEKLALNPTLGRLWRMWRKNVRTPMLSRTLSRESMVRRGLFPLRGTSRASSIATIEEPSSGEVFQKTAATALEEEVNPADIPIPVSENDVDEIEVPGFTTKLSIAVQARSFRPRSLFLSASDLASPTSGGSALHSPALRSGIIDPRTTHYRSQSLPSSPCQPQPNGILHFSPNSAIGSVRDEHSQLETMIEDDELPDKFSGVGSSPPEIPPRSKQRQELADIEDDAESSDHSEIFSSAPTSRLQSPKFPNGIFHQGELPSQRRQEQHVPQPQSVEQENIQRSRVSSLPREDENKEKLQNIQGLKYQYGVNVVEVGRKHRAPEPIAAEDDVSMPSDQSDVEQAHAQSAYSQGSIVETSFVAEINRTAFQPTRLSPHQEVVNSSSGTPDQDSPHSFSGRRSVSTQSGQSPSRSNSQRNKKASNSGNTTPRYTPSSAVSVGSERAAVQRVSPPPPATPRDSGSKPRRSVSISSHRDKRPITSGSTTSQVSNKLLKGLVGRQPTDHDARVPFPTRTSTETSSTLSKFVEAVPDPANLDQLIQSDETIHFTLTPRNMREMEGSNSPRWGTTRSNTADMAEFPRKTSPQRETPSDGRRPSVSSSKLNGLRIHTPSIVSPTKSKFVESPVENLSRPQSSVHKVVIPQARDARVGRESMKDFAEFIRSTGPEQTTAAPKNNSRRTASLINGNSGPASRKPSLTGSGALSATSPRPPHLLAKELPKRPGPRLEARSAVTPKDDGTSDLIDFIREGPQDGSHRIPRTVAPFRTTMDSDEFLLSPGRVNREPGIQSYTPSSHAESTTTKSVPSSYNSRTGLLDSTNRANIRTQNGPSAPSAPFDTGESPMPTRKQRRVKDPYAIDFDSDDEFENEMLSGGLKAHREEEESLADFLRNAPPPRDLDQPPQLLAVNMNAPNKTKIKSTTSMRTRLMRATSVDKVPSAKLSRSSLRSHKSNITTVSSPAGPTAPIPETPRLKVSHSNSHMKRSYSPHSSYSAHVESQYNSRANEPQRSQRSQPRGYQSSTSELADFLKNTAPPEPVARPASRSSFSAEREKGNGSSFSRMFSRMKRQAV